jgi:ferrous iron transport protein A
LRFQAKLNQKYLAFERNLCHDCIKLHKIALVLSLYKLKKGEKARLLRINDTDLESKLLEHGFIQSAELEMIQAAPSGDPIIVEGAFTKLIIRRKEAEQIIVERINDSE